VAKFPEPPGEAFLRCVAPEVKSLPAGTRLTRIYATAGAHPISWNQFRFFGPVDARWDHHEAKEGGEGALQDRGILYAATELDTCLAEFFQNTRRIDRLRRAPWVAIFQLETAVEVLDLTGAFPTRVGASMAIHTGSRARARRWARQFHAAYPALAGLWYPSSMNGNQPAVALNELAVYSLPAHPMLNRALADDSVSHVLKFSAKRLEYRLV
jgi:RES domain